MTGKLYLVATPIGNLGDFVRAGGGNAPARRFYCRRGHPRNAEAFSTIWGCTSRLSVIINTIKENRRNSFSRGSSGGRAARWSPTPGRRPSPTPEKNW